MQNIMSSYHRQEINTLSLICVRYEKNHIRVRILEILRHSCLEKKNDAKQPIGSKRPIEEKMLVGKQAMLTTAGHYQKDTVV